MTETELMAQAVTQFRKHPLVKLVSKTKRDDLDDLAKNMSLEDAIQLFREYRNFIDIPVIKKIINAIDPYAKKSRIPDEVVGTSLIIFDVKRVLQETSRISKNRIPAEIKKELVAWVTNNSRSASISSWATKELSIIPNIRPNTKQLLFRGMLFKGHWFEENWNTSDNPKSPTKIVNHLLSGKTGFPLDLKNASSWTTSKSIADRFASKSAATSQYSAMIQWLHAKGKIDGVLGLILAAYVDPDNIAVDLQKVDIDLQHGDEGEMILKPGKYVTKIVAILTPEGEITVDQFPAYYAEMHAKINAPKK